MKEASLLQENKNPSGFQLVSGRTAVIFIGTVLTVIFTVTRPAHGDATVARTRKEGQGTLRPAGP